MMRLSLANPLLPLIVLALPAPASSALVGDVAACEAGQPAVKVRVSGFKQQAGQIRLALYDQAGWLKKGASLKKVQVPVTGSAVDVCIAVPQPGTYGVAVHHDIDADKKKDRSDGAAFSRNPSLSLLGRPSFRQSSVAVGSGVTPISVQLLYLNGLTIGPARVS